MFKIRFRHGRFLIGASLLVLAQATLLHGAGIRDIRPDLTAAAVVFYALHHDLRRGMRCGMLLGFALDVLSGGVVGINCFSLGLVGALGGRLQGRVYSTHILTTLLVSLGLLLVGQLAYVLCAAQFYHLGEWPTVMRRFAASLLYTTVINVLAVRMFEAVFVERKMTLR
ncbi:MAG: rod shape-determining protein MreD [Candidatus Omnitrophica bacterium]|nr:rod shape-determining protein MreD [Candidatus Omnitrophota bacterium]